MRTGPRFATRFALRLRFDLGAPLIDVCHNSVVAQDDGGRPGWLHRKGAAPATEGFVVVPGSRGSASYIVEPAGDPSACGWSLAHGAGLKWGRTQARDKVAARSTAASLVRTALGSVVICEDRDLLFEEAPEAYKSIDSVIGALVAGGHATVVAVLHPLLTYKVRRTERSRD